jgi:hypothetical protein
MSDEKRDLLHRLGMIGMSFAATGLEEHATTINEAIESLSPKGHSEASVDELFREQTLLVDRLCSAIDLAAEDIGHESIDDLLKLIGPQNERCIEALGGRTALSNSVSGVKL